MEPVKRQEKIQEEKPKELVQMLLKLTSTPVAVQKVLED